MFILVYLGMNGGCDRIGHFFFLLLGFITIASILVCIAQAVKGDPRASFGGSNSSGDPVGGIIYAYTAYVKGD